MTTTRLRELLAAATPGPWRQAIAAIGVGDPPYTMDRIVATTHGGNEANASLIAEAVNALPALLDVVDAAQRAVDLECAHGAEGDLLTALARPRQEPAMTDNEQVAAGFAGHGSHRPGTVCFECERTRDPATPATSEGEIGPDDVDEDGHPLPWHPKFRSQQGGEPVTTEAGRELVERIAPMSGEYVVDVGLEELLRRIRKIERQASRDAEWHDAIVLIRDLIATGSSAEIASAEGLCRALIKMGPPARRALAERPTE